MTRDDLLLGPAEVARFYSGGDVVIEEKVDGANLGISIKQSDYRIYYQNRSHSRPPSPWGAIGGFM